MLRSVIVVLTLSFVSTASAGVVVYDNGPGTGVGATMYSHVTASDFTLAAPAAINLIRFWDFTATTNPADTFTVDWAIYSNVANVPGALLYSGSQAPIRTYLGQVVGIPDIAHFEDELLVPDLALGAGTFWLALDDPTPGCFCRFWEWAPDNGTLGTQTNTIPPLLPWSNYGSPPSEVTFQLEAAPEPAPVVLLGSALLLVFAVSRSRLLRRGDF